MNNPVDDAIAIWKAGVAAVEPRKLVRDFIENYYYEGEKRSEYVLDLLRSSEKIFVVGAGKAGAAMALGLEEGCGELCERLTGIVNVPDGFTEKCRRIRLHSARPAGSNFPTAAGVEGSEEMLRLFRSADAKAIGICLLSGGGSALLPAPADGITLEDKLTITKLLHTSGATIHELNCVRKHLSRIKGGQLAQQFQGKILISLNISDVLDDDISVIASGPTAPDPTTFQDALRIIEKYDLVKRSPINVLNWIQKGIAGHIPETPKRLYEVRFDDVFPSPSDDEREAQSNLGHSTESGPPVLNWSLARNAHAVQAASVFAISRNYYSNFSIPYDRGEAQLVASQYCKILRGPHKRPKAIYFGGETTVTLGPNPGKGGRNQEFVLAMLCELGLDGMKGVTILSGGTDGEDGPTDAAGAIGTEETLRRAQALNLNPRDFLDRHDAYHFFEATGGLFKTGLTGTNVMDLGVILLH